MKPKYAIDYVRHMRDAAQDALTFVEGLALDDFLTDKRTQQAVIMSLVIVGEAAGKLMDRFPAFCEQHSDIPWRNMRGMRNRIAHGYFDINLDMVWATISEALPELLTLLERVEQ